MGSSKHRRRRHAGAILGILLVGAAPVLRLGVTPLLAQSPATPGTTAFTSAGTVTSLFDVSAAQDQPEQVPVNVTRTVTTTGDQEASEQEQTAGSNVAVTDTVEQTLTADGRLVDQTQARLAADRRTQALVDCCGARVSGTTFSMAGAGSPLRLPWFTPQATYPYLDTTLMAPVEMAYLGHDTVDGADTLKFQQATGPTELGTVPVPGELIGEEGTVRLARAYSVNRSLWVDPTTGIIVRSSERVRQTLRDDSGRDVVTLLSMTLGSTPETEAAQLRAARAEGRPVLWAHTYGPLLCLALGVLLLVAVVVGAVLRMRERRVEEDFPDELATFEDLRETFDEP